MSTTTDAIADIQEALDEYGTVVTIRTVTQDSYAPYTGAAETPTDVVTKAFVAELASYRITRAFPELSYELSLKLYSDSVITKEHKILYNAQEYKIVHVSSKILTGVTLIYEILIKR